MQAHESASISMHSPMGTATQVAFYNTTPSALADKHGIVHALLSIKPKPRNGCYTVPTEQLACAAGMSPSQVRPALHCHINDGCRCLETAILVMIPSMLLYVCEFKALGVRTLNKHLHAALTEGFETTARQSTPCHSLLHAAYAVGLKYSPGLMQLHAS